MTNKNSNETLAPFTLASKLISAAFAVRKLRLLTDFYIARFVYFSHLIINNNY